ncbi:MAG: transcriptional activator NhaR [Myxococcales bacterium]|nr:transcriptional activator NhaR [Myxococcales bacterium]
MSRARRAPERLRSTLRSLNYHHLVYLWTVAEEGTVTKAAKRLGLAQPTISAQLKALEEQLEVELFDRSGRNLLLTDAGRVVHRYADEILALGREMLDVLNERTMDRPIQLKVGLALVVPKLIAYQLLRPSLELSPGVLVECYEDKTDRLLAQLATHELDLVITDAPLGSGAAIKAYNHHLGRSATTFFAARPLALRLRRGFPHSLDGAPYLMPMRRSALRRDLELWFESLGVRPHVVGEFDDSALLKVFGQSGVGAFAAPSVIEKQVKQQYGVQVIGRTDEVIEHFYAISAERRVRHPGVVAIANVARQQLFG